MNGHENKAVRSANRKFFARTIPMLILMLIINQIDRTNVGFIKHSLETDVGISTAAFGFGAGLFFVGYALFEIPSNMLMDKYGARVWLTRIMITWGAVVFAMGFVTTPMQFYVLTFYSASPKRASSLGSYFISANGCLTSIAGVPRR